MSDEPIYVTDPGFGEFIVSANSHYDHERGLWFKPWTDKPARAVVGYVVVRHPGDEIVGYTYLYVDVATGALRWYTGTGGSPELDLAVAELYYGLMGSE